MELWSETADNIMNFPTGRVGWDPAKRFVRPHPLRALNRSYVALETQPVGAVVDDGGRGPRRDGDAGLRGGVV